jgi:predicted AAA+ superfamily ATPase
MTPRGHKGLFSALVGTTQETLDSWLHKLDGLITVKKEAELSHAQLGEKILPLLRKAKENSISARELAEIIPIGHATISRWMQLLEGVPSGEQGQGTQQTQA